MLIAVLLMHLWSWDRRLIAGYGRRLSAALSALARLVNEHAGLLVQWHQAEQRIFRICTAIARKQADLGRGWRPAAEYAGWMRP